MSSIKKLSYSSMKHDGIVTVWVAHLLYFVVVDPVDLEYILKMCLEKDDAHRFLRKASGNGSVFAPVSIWKPRRKIVTTALGPIIMESFTNRFVKHSQSLVKNLARCNTGKKMDMWPFISAYALDSILESMTGNNYNMQENFDHPFLKAINQLLELISERILHFWLHPEWIFRLFPQYKTHQESIKCLHDFGDKTSRFRKDGTDLSQKVQDRLLWRILGIVEAIKERTSIIKDFYEKGIAHKKNVFLDILIKLSGGENGFTNLELREEAGVLVLASTDTTSTSLANTLLLLAKYPEIQEKLYQELFEIFGDSNRPPVKEDIIRLTYLEQVIKESLRVLPPVPILIRKVLQDLKLPSGRVLPAGSGVMCSIWGAHRDPKYWGPNAEHFDPSRFEPGRLNIKHACSFMPFSNGPRNCIGTRYAMMSMKTVLSAILREYKVVGDRENGPIPKTRDRIDIMMKAVDGYKFVLEKRHKVM